MRRDTSGLPPLPPANSPNPLMAANSLNPVEYDWPIQLFTPVSSCFISSRVSVMWSKITRPFTNLPAKLIVIALFGRFKKVIPHYQTEGVSIQSHLQLDVHQDSHMVLQQLLFNGIGNEELKFDADTFLLELNFKINSTNSIFLHQISTSSWLYICISIWIFQLLCAAWVIIQALLVRRVYNRVYGQFSPHLLWL